MQVDVLGSKRRLALVAVLIASILMMLPSFAYATSGQWVKYVGNPVLGPTSGSWDADYAISPRVLFDDHTFRMWYDGGNTITGANGIGYATSADGFNWVKHGDRVLTPGPSGAWDSGMVKIGSVVWNGSLFLMWYTGTNMTTNTSGAVGLATSTDGVSWVKFPGNPILQTSTFGLDQKYVDSPVVVQMPLSYSMWYSGTGSNITQSPSRSISTILYATSGRNLQAWTKLPLAAIVPSPDPNRWDSGAVYSPSVVHNDTSFELWYTGLNYSMGMPQIGFASSLDGNTWIKSPMNPALSPGPVGSWDSAGVEQPSVILYGHEFFLYYDGFSKTTAGRIGLALDSGSLPIPEFPAVASDVLLAFMLTGTMCFIHHRKPK